ncbi:hypothetical protein B1810_16605 [Panacagrimonas perspica]|nr:hypothetical protein B1810_16605 [Panacagrimonas perspica]
MSGPTTATVIPIVVVAQLACTSLWFAGNAVLPDIQMLWQLPAASAGMILSAVQAGFVVGTLLFAVYSLSDRFRASTVFLACAVLGALSNLAIATVCDDVASLMAARFLTGFFLAGIYPVGMKIAASWCAGGLGKALGYLVGALVLGTALPYFIRGLGADLPWASVVVTCSIVSVLGGLAIYFWVPSGPYLPARSPFDLSALPKIFRSKDLRAAAFGYFGHMWELYALWAFVPLIFRHYAERNGLAGFNVALASSLMIGAGAIGCILGGELVQRFGSARVALTQLLTSGLLCVLSVFIFEAPPLVFFALLGLWGMTVAGDSPQFSSLVGANAPRAYVGTAFTIVNCIGFSITAVSIHLLGYLSTRVPTEYLFLALAPGPLVGLTSAGALLRRRNVAAANAQQQEKSP